MEASPATVLLVHGDERNRRLAAQAASDVGLKLMTADAQTITTALRVTPDLIVIDGQGDGQADALARIRVHRSGQYVPLAMVGEGPSVPDGMATIPCSPNDEVQVAAMTKAFADVDPLASLAASYPGGPKRFLGYQAQLHQVLGKAIEELETDATSERITMICHQMRAHAHMFKQPVAQQLEELELAAPDDERAPGLLVDVLAGLRAWHARLPSP